MNNYFYALFLLFLTSPQLIGKVKIEKFVFEKMPIIGKYRDKNISLGGFSGLFFLEKKNDGNLIFLTHTDRGPNGEIITDKNGQKVRPFFLPEFQPEIIKFEVNTKSKKITILNRIKLFNNNMKPITGLPNLFEKNLKDEYPVDGSGKKLYFDPIGGDFEGISFSKNGEYFLVDEYRPSIFHFNEKGLLIKRYIPTLQGIKNSKIYGQESLPSSLNLRTLNRGFEAISQNGDKILAFLQSPLNNSKIADFVRVIEFDTKKETSSGEYIYCFNSTDTDKIGDATLFDDSSLLVLEQNSIVGKGSVKQIFKTSINSATNLNTITKLPLYNKLEKRNCNQLKNNKIVSMKKTLFFDLSKNGLVNHSKLEGLALISSKQIAVLNDNDFAIEKNEDSVLYLITL